MLPVQVSMDVTSLYTNIPQEEGITIICKAYETFYRNEPETPDTQATKRRTLSNLLEKNYRQVQGTGAKMAVAFANILCLQ